MKVVSKKKLVEYYNKHPNSKTALEEWHKKVSKSEWSHLNELKQQGTIKYSRKKMMLMDVEALLSLSLLKK